MIHDLQRLPAAGLTLEQFQRRAAETVNGILAELTAMGRDFRAEGVLASSAGPLVLLSIPVPAGRAVGIEAEVIQKVTAGSSAGGGQRWLAEACFRNVSGTVTQVGATVELVSLGYGGDFDPPVLGVSGDRVLVLVDGDAAHTVRFSGWATLRERGG